MRMDSLRTIADTLRIPDYCCRRLSADRVVCIVTEDWVKQIHLGNIQPLKVDSSFCTATAEKYLAHSCTAVPLPWMRLTVKLWAKSQEGVLRIVDSGLGNPNPGGETVLELLGSISRENLSNLWHAAQHKYRHAQSQSQPVRSYQLMHQASRDGNQKNEPMSDKMWHWLRRLSPDVHICVGEDADDTSSKREEGLGMKIPTAGSTSSLKNLLQAQAFMTTHSWDDGDQFLHSVTRIRVLVETASSFLLVQPYLEYTLRDVLSYSPAIFDTCYSKPLFVTYQILQALLTLHKRGIPAGMLSLDTVLLDSDLWVSVLCPQKHALVQHTAACSNAESKEIGEVLQSYSDPGAVSAGDKITGTCGLHKETSKIGAAVESVSSQPNTNEYSISHFRSQTLGSAPWATTHPSGSYIDEDELVYQEGCKFLQEREYISWAQRNIWELLQAWVERRISNFQYLLVLNHLAGRQMNDPNNHPVLPWVMDFSHPHDGYRDLTKSKYRLNKGDRQLDFTYGLESSYTNTTGGDGHNDSENIPHHVSDVLSDITYYVYKARRIPKSILCSHVRSVWVPHEYPASMQRLQSWTPDECIPEFYTDPQIFLSIHSDLPDLEIPPWCSSTREFVVRHMAVLESEKVSEQLHHWIDLTFGHKLSGKAAVASKNVYLQLVDGHQILRSHGVVQLFTQSHPHRAALNTRPLLASLRSMRDMNAAQLSEDLKQESMTFETSYDNISAQAMAPEVATIVLPPTFDPLADLDHCEAVHSFRSRALLQTQTDTAECAPFPSQLDVKSRHHGLVVHDMASFLCLVCELFLAPRMRMQEEPSLSQRMKSIKVLCNSDISLIPRPFQRAAKILLTDLYIDESSNDSMFAQADRGGVRFSPVLSGGFPPPTPALLLHPDAEVFPFPPYFRSLYSCLCRLKATDEAMLEVKRGTETAAEKTGMLKQLARSKVPVMEQFLLRWGDALGKEGFRLVLPLVESLLTDRLTTVQAAWLLFSLLSRALGPAATLATFLPSLSALFSEGPATAKHIKLYHRTYLIQLLLRLHLQPFLHHFATLLVEAVAGYKDFPVPSRFYSQELMDDLDTVDDARLTMDVCSSAAPDVALVEEIQEVDEAEDVLETVADGVQVNEDDDESREEFVDTMSLGDDEGATDALDFTSRDENSSVDGISQGENGEDAAFDADRCSIHSISNIICRISGNVLDARVGSAGEDDDDKVFESPGATEGGLSKEASTVSLGALCGDSLSSGLDTPIADFEDAPDYLESSILQRPVTLQDVGMVKMCDNITVKDTGRLLYVSVDKPGENDDSNKDSRVQEEATDGSTVPQQRKVSDSMRRSETEDLMSTLSLSSPTSAVNIRHIAADSVNWLATKLGPVLAARHLSRNLVRMLPLCYLGESQLLPMEDKVATAVKTSRCAVGDGNAHKVLDCVGFMATLYGENIILIQYLPSITDMISVAQRRFTQRSESGLLAAVVLMRFVVPLLSDKTLMDILEDQIVNECITPVLSLLTSNTVSFPSGALCRSLLCHKLLDLFYVLGIRLGLEMTRKFLTKPMLVLMEAFSAVHAPEPEASDTCVSVSPVVGTGNLDESYLTIKMDSVTHQYTIGTPVNPNLLSSPGVHSLSLSLNNNRWHSLAAMGAVDEREECLSPRPSQENAEKCSIELAAVFTPELALAAYIPLCRIFGSIHMEESLKNDDLIRQLCAQQDSTMDQPPPVSPVPQAAIEDGKAGKETVTGRPTASDSGCDETRDAIGGLGSNVEVVGNRIQLSDDRSEISPLPPSFTAFGRGYRHDGILKITNDELRSHEMESNRRRHLHGNWLQYWEHELGLHERDTLFNFKQIKLQTFVGHTNSIRCIMPMDTENCFISTSKDKMVRLWAVTSCGDGTSKVPSQWTYQQHKKSVFSVAYVESMRQVVSCDGTVHVWDPYTGVGLCQLDSARYPQAAALQAIPAPSPLTLIGTAEATLKFLDLRTLKYAHEFKCSTGSLGLLRCVGVCPEGSWVAVGFSTGIISILELSSGLLMSSMKAHDSEILQLKAYSKHKLVSSSFDGTLKVWNVDSGSEICSLKGATDPVHCFSFYRDQVLSATTQNRIGVHTCVGENAKFNSVKLRSDTFKGVLTSMAVLPLNRTLLLGSDNGSIYLLA